MNKPVNVGHRSVNRSTAAAERNIAEYRRERVPNDPALVRLDFLRLELATGSVLLACISQAIVRPRRSLGELEPPITSRLESKSP